MSQQKNERLPLDAWIAEALISAAGTVEKHSRSGVWPLESELKAALADRFAHTDANATVATERRLPMSDWDPEPYGSTSTRDPVMAARRSSSSRSTNRKRRSLTRTNCSGASSVDLSNADMS